MYLRPTSAIGGFQSPLYAGYYYVNLTQARVTEEEGAWIEKLFPKAGLQASLSDPRGKPQATVGGATAGQVVLGSIRKQAKQPVSSTYHSTASASALTSRFLPCLGLCPDFL